MGLLVLAIFPGVGGGNNRQAEPAGRPPDFFLVPGKNQLLADGAKHFHAEGLIAGDQIQPRLIGQTSRYHRFFVQCRDDLAVHRLLIVLGIVHPVLQIIQHSAKTIACQLVRIAHSGPEVRVLGHQRTEKIIHSLHRRGAFPTGRKPGDYRVRWIAGRESMITLKWPRLPGVLVKMSDSVLKLIRSHPQSGGMLVKQLPGPGIHSRVSGQWQVVGCIAAGAIKTIPLGGLRNAIGYPNGIAALSP